MKPRTILVVDDEPSIVELMSRALRKRGDTVVSAKDGVEAGRVVTQHPFELVMTDLLMPDKDGIQVITELRRKYPSMKIIAMSGGGHITQDQYLKIAKGLGAHALLEKPFTIDQLYAVVDSVLPAAE
jgi:CheY-like chemotaxis protein